MWVEEKKSDHQTKGVLATRRGMTNVERFEGLLSCVLIFICSCALVKRVRAFKSLLNWKQFGPLSIFHKASVIGLRLKKQTAIACVVLALYMLFC